MTSARPSPHAALLDRRRRLERLGRGRRLRLRRGGSLLLAGATALRRIGREDAGLARARVLAVADAVVVAVGERATRTIGIGRRAGRGDGAGIVGVRDVVAVFVALRAAGAERIGMFALRLVAAQILIVTDAIAIRVGHADLVR